VEVSRKKLVLVLAVVGAIAVAVGLSLYFDVWSGLGGIRSSDPVEISKQSATVRRYLKDHPNAEYRIDQLYLMGDGSFYLTDGNWNITELLIGTSHSLKDGKDHYCWGVLWYDDSIVIEHVVYVYIDKDTLKILLVDEAS